MENITIVNLFQMRGLQETWMNKSVYFPLALVTYLLIISINLTLIVTIIMEKRLHEPMYIFICSLSINALFGTAGFYPVILPQLLEKVNVISYFGCLTQAYVIHTYSMCEITILSVMAFDRYVAICRALHYHTLMSPLNVRRLLLFAWFYPLLALAMSAFFIFRLPLCGIDLYKVFCDYASILKHSCIPITMNRLWNNILLVFHVVLSILIAYSYCQIIWVCVNSAERRNKFTQTFVPHLLTIIVFVIVSIFDVSYVWYDNKTVPIHVRNVIVVQFLVIPPIFNPLIYGLNLKLIRRTLLLKCWRNHI